MSVRMQRDTRGKLCSASNSVIKLTSLAKVRVEGSTLSRYWNNILTNTNKFIRTTVLLWAAVPRTACPNLTPAVFSLPVFIIFDLSSLFVQLFEVLACTFQTPPRPAPPHATPTRYKHYSYYRLLFNIGGGWMKCFGFLWMTTPRNLPSELVN